MVTKTLWDVDIEGITYKDIEDFLSLNLQEDKRPKEGTRLDYKVDIPKNLGKIITAFANTYGGLCILGVDEKNGIPTNIIGVPNPTGSDIKTQIANIIRSNVYPPPMIRIGVVPLPNNKNHCVVAVKVEEGEDPPYVWQHDKKEEIYIRDNDTCRLATLSKIETLFKKRAKLQEEKSKRGHFINPSVFIPEEGDSVNNYNQSFHCMPFGDVTLIMDKKDEDEMRQLVISNLKMLNYETDNNGFNAGLSMVSKKLFLEPDSTLKG